MALSSLAGHGLQRDHRGIPAAVFHAARAIEHDQHVGREAVAGHGVGHADALIDDAGIIGLRRVAAVAGHGRVVAVAIAWRDGPGGQRHVDDAVAIGINAVRDAIAVGINRGTVRLPIAIEVDGRVGWVQASGAGLGVAATGRETDAHCQESPTVLLHKPPFTSSPRSTDRGPHQIAARGRAIVIRRARTLHVPKGSEKSQTGHPGCWFAVATRTSNPNVAQRTRPLRHALVLRCVMAERERIRHAFCR